MGISTEMVRRWGHSWGDDKGFSCKGIQRTGTGFSGMRLSIISEWLLAEKMGTSNSIYWCRKAGGIISIEKAHDTIQVKPNDLEGQANETKLSWIIHKVQAHAQGTRHPSFCNHQESCQLKMSVEENLFEQVAQWPKSSDLALATQLPKPNQEQEGKRQAQDSAEKGLQQNQINSTDHWAWAALGSCHRVAVYCFPWTCSWWRNRLSEHKAGADHRITGEAILRHQTWQVWLFNQRKAKAENRHGSPL